MATPFEEMKKKVEEVHPFLAQRGGYFLRGRTLSEETKRKMSESHKRIQPLIHTPEFNKKTGDAQKGKVMSAESREKMSLAHLGKPLNEAQKKGIGEASKRTWANLSEEEKQKRLSNILSKSSSRPNIPEMKIVALLDYLFPGEYEYAENGKITMESICPDFVNVNGKKKVIEHFSDY